MAKIIKLDQHTANLIAAGEVIERAASVVKELVENSIDAEAKNISISLTDSGQTEIVVTDDGIGMDAVDARMCVEPHATSKIKNDQDLFRIRTLGFRGEALPSIVSVSNFRLKTSVDGTRGILYSLKGGTFVSEAVIACPRGTEISVRNLFYNTPARLQNLQSQAQELSYITDYVNRIALARPDIAFKLTNNDRLLLQTFGNDNLLEAISQIYGVDTAKHMLQFYESIGYFQVSGYTSDLNITRANKSQITIIVNERVIKNYAVTNAILAAYKDRLVSGRYPIVVLKINADPALIDVNIHPAKLEVRFANENELLNLITHAISYALHNSEMIVEAEEKKPETALPKEEEKKEVQEAFRFADLDDLDNADEKDDIEDEDETDDLEDADDADYMEDEDSDYNLDDFDDFNEDLYKDDFNESFKSEPKEDDQKDILGTDDDDFSDLFKEDAEEPKYFKTEELLKKEPEKTLPRFEQQEYSFVEEKEEPATKSVLPKMYYIGQLHGTYLLFQDEDNFYMIDQHAAYERINYEKIKRELQKEKSISYELLIPLKLNFTISESLLITEKMEELKNLGIIIEDFGGGTFTVREIPIWIPKGVEKEFIEEIINAVIKRGKVERIEFLDALAKSLACKRSIKANQYLDKSVIDYLINDLSRCENPYNCPHGRPIIVKFKSSEIEKWFRRIVS